MFAFFFSRVMDAPSSSSTFQTPFPTNSVNVLCATTNSGKSTLALNIIKHQHIYFARPLKKILVVLCNPIIDNSEFYTEGVSPELQSILQVTSLDELNLEQDLEEGTFLIFEDVQFLDKKILNAVNLHAHHSHLESVFLIVQGLLGSPDLFKLISLAHRIVLFFGSAASTRVAKYVVTHFFLDPELKEYLHKIISEAEKNKSILLLDINQINGKYKPKFLAISGLDKLAEMKPAIVYPQLNEQDNYDQEFEGNLAEMDHSRFPPGSFVLVPAANVKQKVNQREEEDDEEVDKKTEWERMSDIVERNIDASVPFKKKGPAKNVAMALLQCNKFAVSNDGKTIHIKEDEKKSKIPMLDFILTAIRASGPNEPVNDTFKKFMAILLNNHTPKSFFKNKSLIQAAENIKKRKRETLSSFGSKSNKKYLKKNGKKKFQQTLDRQRSRGRKLASALRE